jgi:hypothetical protein
MIGQFLFNPRGLNVGSATRPTVYCVLWPVNSPVTDLLCTVTGQQSGHRPTVYCVLWPVNSPVTALLCTVYCDRSTVRSQPYCVLCTVTGQLSGHRPTVYCVLWPVNSPVKDLTFILRDYSSTVLFSVWGPSISCEPDAGNQRWSSSV